MSTDANNLLAAGIMLVTGNLFINDRIDSDLFEAALPVLYDLLGKAYAGAEIDEH